MSRAGILYKNQQYQKATQMPFVLRLQHKQSDEEPSKVDCIHLLRQYYFIYKAMEARLDMLFTEHEYLAFFKHPPWDKRSNLLLDDIDEMESSLEHDERIWACESKAMLPATEHLVSLINSANSMHLLAFFIVRLSVDVFTGEKLNHHIQKTFKDIPLKGQFYECVVGNAKTIEKYVNTLSLNEAQEQALFNAVEAVSKAHIALFQQMEQTRH